MKAPFPRMSYDDAVKKLQSKGSEIQWGGDFGNTDETLLTDDLDGPVMVDRYPAEIKAFYFETDPDRPELALGVDVHRARRLWRNHRRRTASARSRPADEAHRRTQSSAVPPSSGIWICGNSAPFRTRASAWAWSGASRGSAGLEHVRETIPYPRMLYRTRP